MVRNTSFCISRVKSSSLPISSSKDSPVLKVSTYEVAEGSMEVESVLKMGTKLTEIPSLVTIIESRTGFFVGMVTEAKVTDGGEAIEATPL